jgi:nitrilase
MSASLVGALQLGASPDGTAATLATLLSYEADIRAQGLNLVVLPEALLGGYPKGSDFGARLGYRTPEGRQEFRRYWEQAITPQGPEVAALSALSARTGAALVVGVIERAGYTLYCSVFFFTPDAGLAAIHRKLMPTGTERLIWGQGDGSTLPVVRTSAGIVGAAICWENYMPLLRSAMIAKGVEIWCAPTVDEREIWQASMRHIAYEGRCFVISACQIQPSPADLGLVLEGWDPQRRLIRGGSTILSPLGEVLAGPLYDQEGLITAAIDPATIAEARYDLDITGHYARPDIFSLRVDETPRPAVHFHSSNSQPTGEAS